jgi:ubiquinone/menaquinone biosynthesis C-methylase UbiE
MSHANEPTAMTLLGDRLLTSRAARVAKRVVPHLPPRGRVLDVGSGTGHNARRLRATTGLEVVEADVASLAPAGQGPVLFSGTELPFEDRAFDAALLLYVLHYADDAAALLRDTLRVARRVVVIQSTFEGTTRVPERASRASLALRDAFLGRFALRATNALGYTDAPLEPLRPRRFFSRPELRALFEKAGARGVTEVPGAPSLFGLRRELHVLEPRELEK